MGHQRRHLDVEHGGEGGGDQQQQQQPAKPVTSLMPRALVAKHAAADDHKPKTNEDFKKMLQ
jgi:hypothetical protein